MCPQKPELFLHSLPMGQRHPPLYPPPPIPSHHHSSPLLSSPLQPSLFSMDPYPKRRRPRSIFTITVEDDDDDDPQKKPPPIRRSTTNPLPLLPPCKDGGACGCNDPVGLRILIHNFYPPTSTHDSSLSKATLRARARRPPALPELSFLKACHLCGKDLSPKEDVYIYRGDKAFCSVECRCTQISMDERTELKKTTFMDPRRHASDAGARRLRQPEDWRRVPVTV